MMNSLKKQLLDGQPGMVEGEVLGQVWERVLDRLDGYFNRRFHGTEWRRDHEKKSWGPDLQPVPVKTEWLGSNR